MTLDEMILDQIKDWRNYAGRQTKTFAHDDSEWTVNLAADRCDELGAVVWEMNLRRDPPARTRETIASWAERIVRRTNGLLEPLHVWEIDPERNVGFLRSATPTIRGNTRQYYEIEMHGITSATVRRYQSEGTGRREQIPFTLTHEGLAKLAGDVASE